MSINYAEALSPYPNKGKLGQKEITDNEFDLIQKINELTNDIRNAKFIVVLTGAGISTSAGIPDFRGPNGVWTMEQKRQEPKSVDFATAKPTFTHYALVALEKIGKIKHLISQNVDNLHIKSGFPVNRLLEVHGNCFVDQCKRCKKYYYRKDASKSVGCKQTGMRCNENKCRGFIHDTVLDWESELPDEYASVTIPYLKKADLFIVLGSSLQIQPVGNEYASVTIPYLKKADLFIVLGSSLQIQPVGSLPTVAKKTQNVKVAYVNLQKINKKIFDLTIHAPVDKVFRKIMENLEIPVEEKFYDEPVIFSKFSLEQDGIKNERFIANKKYKKEKGEAKEADNVEINVSHNEATGNATVKEETLINELKTSEFSNILPNKCDEISAADTYKT
uniref:Deacetylase sirtuin-type domain-containing protein n=1 Tax=Panagrolaimus sp. PS1159 TaxID=55785 RepID=A0AC35FVX2_9BILA